MSDKCRVSFRVKNCPRALVHFGSMWANGCISQRVYESIVKQLCDDAVKNKKSEKEKAEYREFYKKNGNK
jgi:hypothetical protein